MSASLQAWETERKRVEANRFALLLRDILAHLPDTRMSEAIAQIAHAEAVPSSLLLAIVMIESNRRPTYIRAIENLVFRANLFCHRLLRLPLADLSVGPCQIKVSTASGLLGLPFRRTGYALTLGSTRQERHQCCAVLARLTNPDVNIRLAARYLQHLSEGYGRSARTRRGTAAALAADMVIYVACHYNGLDVGDELVEDEIVSYPKLLAALVRHLEARRHGRMAPAG